MCYYYIVDIWTVNWWESPSNDNMLDLFSTSLLFDIPHLVFRNHGSHNPLIQVLNFLSTWHDAHEKPHIFYVISFHIL